MGSFAKQKTYTISIIIHNWQIARYELALPSMSKHHKPFYPKDWLPSFVKRKGRGISLHQQTLYDELLPTLSITLPSSGFLNPDELFDTTSHSVWLEIGFGGGEHLSQQARHHENIAFIGCEVFESGIASLLSQVEKHAQQNIRIFTDDARALIHALPDNSLDRLFILFPDPWPKKKHHKRRIINHTFLDLITKKLKNNAHVRIASDHMEYIRWILVHMQQHASFCLETRNRWSKAPSNHFTTRYETKQKTGQTPLFLDYYIRKLSVGG